MPRTASTDSTAVVPGTGLARTLRATAAMTRRVALNCILKKRIEARAFDVLENLSESDGVKSYSGGT